MTRLAFLLLLVAPAILAQPKRVLYVTHSAGFRHDCLPLSATVLESLATRSGKLAVTATEDLSLLNHVSLLNYDAVIFYTSGELPISTAQKEDLLAFVRSGKGFGGAHSATDTLYAWPDYGDLIGARFNGHPWVQEVRIDIEDPDHPAVSHVKPSFSIVDEIYQFREFSRERNRVLMTLDTRSVDLTLSGVNPGTEDFPLAWCRQYGNGRAFYTALGHFDGTWRDERFQQMMLSAMLWLTGQVDGSAAVRAPGQPALAAEAIGNSASLQPRMTISPGSLMSMFGRNLTTGSTLAADPRNPAYKLGGTTVKLNGAAVPLLYASPAQINAYVPLDLKPTACDPSSSVRCAAPFYALELSAGGGPATAMLNTAETTPGIFTVTVHGTYASIWATGLGPVERNANFEVTKNLPVVKVEGVPVRTLFSGLASGWTGLYQVNVELPTNLPSSALLEFELGGYTERVRIQAPR